MSSEKVRMPYGSPVSERVSRRERAAGQLGSVLGVVGATAVFASAVVLAVVFHNMHQQISNMADKVQNFNSMAEKFSTLEHEIAKGNARHEKEISNLEQEMANSNARHEKEMSSMMIEVANLKGFQARAERDQQETVALRERVAVLESQNRGMNFQPDRQEQHISNTGSVLNPQADDVTVIDSELPSKNDSVGGLLRRRKRDVSTPNWVRVPIGPSGCQSGRDGRDGIPGAAGSPGAAGPPGPKGEPGTGQKGDMGSVGAQGPEGLKGAKGDIGVQGLQGPKGDRGSASVQGSKGQKGDRGSTGLQGSKGQKGDSGSTGLQGSKGGAVYVRWGRTTCPSGATKVYNGYAGGTQYNQPGGGTNYQCLPTDPQWGRYQDGVQGYKAYMYGAEYQLHSNVPFGSTSLHNNNVPCAVCYVPTRGSKLMIPARNTCYSGWTREYHGYLMAEYYNHNSPKEYVCVDEQPEAVPGGHANHDGALFYPVEARCGSLPCPRYVEGRELTCVVCTK
ncbi:uncharacterized protein LOC144925972 isoform X2 [Branchiostoma floridae x Branchiostoma belcheri]